MKRTTCIAIVLASVVSGSTLDGGDLNTPFDPTMAKIREALPIPDGWHCETDYRCMVISRREPVTLLNLVGLPDSASDSEVLEEFGRKTHYQIVLLFLPRLTEEELRELRAVRTRAIERARAKDDPKGSRSARAARRIVLPVYFISRSSIYIFRTDDGPMEIYPKKVAAERDAILRTLETLFEKH